MGPPRRFCGVVRSLAFLISASVDAEVRMSYREVSVEQVREVLRAWLDGVGLRTVAMRAGVDRKTARRYVDAAEQVGVVRGGGAGQLDDAVIGQVVGLVRPARPSGHGTAWDTL